MTPLRNRIVGHEEVAPDQLLAHPENWRIHTSFQREALERILDRVGFVRPILVNRTTGRVVDGHLRVEIALKRDEETIPVDYVDLTEEEEALVLATHDPIASYARPFKDNVARVLERVRSDDAHVVKVLSDVGQKAGLYRDSDSPCERAPATVRIPMAIAVDRDMCRRVQQLKEDRGLKSDTEVFEYLMDQVNV